MALALIGFADANKRRRPVTPRSGGAHDRVGIKIGFQIKRIFDRIDMLTTRAAVTLGNPSGRLKPNLAQHPARCGVVCKVACRQLPVTDGARNLEHPASRFGSEAMAPEFACDPIADFARAFMFAHPGAPNHPGARQRDKEMRQVRILRQRRKAARRILAIRPRRPRKVARNRLIAADARKDRFPIFRESFNSFIIKFFISLANIA